MPGRELPARATPVSPAEVYLALRLQLQTQLGAEQTTRAGTMILLGQMALETGRFKSSMNYNLGGVKCGPQWEGCWQHFTTHEIYPRARVDLLVASCPPGASIKIVRDLGDRLEVEISGKHPDNKFRAFEDLDSSVASHVRFLLAPRYRQAVFLAMAGQPDNYAKALRVAGYYTGDADVYARNVRQLAREYDQTLPADAPAPARPVNEPKAAEALAVEPPPQTPVVAPPAQPAVPTMPVPAPVVAAVSLPRVGDPKKEEPRPWWVRLVVGLTRWMLRLLVRRRLP